MFVNSDVSFNFNGKWNTERQFWTNWIPVSRNIFMLATQVGCFGQVFVLELKNLQKIQPVNEAYVCKQKKVVFVLHFINWRIKSFVLRSCSTLSFREKVL